MEKHKCKLCLRSFSNGRALGGHMRSHMLNLPIVQKPESPPPPPPQPPPPPLQPQPQPQPQQPPHNQLSGTLSASFSSSSSSEDDDDDEKGIYGLRENPKRSIRLVDPEFVDGGSVVLPDRESETESSKNPTRKRSKRTRTLDQNFHHQYHHHRIQEQAEAMKKHPKFKYKAVAADQSSWAEPEPEPVSSISDTTQEEHVAFCLMMLSRDKWKKQEQQQPQGNNEEDNEDDDVDEDEDEEDEEEEEEEEQEQEQEEEDEAVESDESEELIKLSKTTTRTRGKFKCETCKKTFRSYQALGGHRASHKKIKLLSSTTTPANNYEPKLEHRNVGTPEKKIHECPVCFRVFSSGQALGGHKRTHVTGSTSAPTSARASTKLGQALIDLNLPAPMEDDDISQVSDAEFVNPFRR